MADAAIDGCEGEIVSREEAGQQKGNNVNKWKGVAAIGRAGEAAVTRG